MRSTLGETRRPFEQSPTWPPNDVFLERDLEICVEENNFALNTKPGKCGTVIFTQLVCLSLFFRGGEEGEGKLSVFPLCARFSLMINFVGNVAPFSSPKFGPFLSGVLFSFSAPRPTDLVCVFSGRETHYVCMPFQPSAPFRSAAATA